MKHPPPRFALLHGQRVEYIGHDGHITPDVSKAQRFVTPGGARRWAEVELPDFHEAWFVVELEEP